MLLTYFGLKKRRNNKPPSAIQIEATTNGWLEVTLVVM
jgi:hypothetical protein